VSSQAPLKAEFGPYLRATNPPGQPQAIATPTLPFATTLRVKDCCLCLHLQRAARAVARRFDFELRPFGLTNGQFSLLMSLNRPQPPAMGPVAALLAVDRTTLTAALKPLERRRLVSVMPDLEDRRSRILKLTEKGHALLIEAMPTWERVHAEIESRMGGERLAELRQTLRSLG
jgi:DNA-binding MarR family transcriptional regulator